MEPSTPAQPKKRLLFIRHVQALHNLLLSKGRRDEGQSCRDPRLTAKGFEEATALKYDLAATAFDCVISSPLTRALETAAAVFQGRFPVEACPLVTERVNPSLADIGRPPSLLAEEFPGVKGVLPGLDEEWWPSPGTAGEPMESVRARAKRFLDWLIQRPVKQESLAIITHCTFLKELTGVSLRNGGYVEFDLFPDMAKVSDPDPGYFGRFIHMAWATYGGKAASVYDTVAMYCLQPSLQRHSTPGPSCDIMLMSGFVNPLCIEMDVWVPGDVIATLPFPAHTAPAGPLSFCLLGKPLEGLDEASEVQAVRVDVLPSGHVVYQGSSAGLTKGYVNLTGIVYPLNGIYPVQLGEHFCPHQSFLPPSFSITSPAMVFGGYSHATSPPEQRFAVLQGCVGRRNGSPLTPGDTLGYLQDITCLGTTVFACIGSDNTLARIDVTVDGRIVYRGSAGGSCHSWVSLAGVVIPLSPVGGVGHSFAPPGVSCGRGFGAYFGPIAHSDAPRHGFEKHVAVDAHVSPRAFLLSSGLVVLVGLVEKHGRNVWHKGDNVGMLDERHRPAVRTVFRVVGQHNQLVRLDVLPDGRVLYIGCDGLKGGHPVDNGWISFSGVYFVAAQFDTAHTLSLGNTVRPGGASGPIAGGPHTLILSDTEAESARAAKSSHLWKWQFRGALYPRPDGVGTDHLPVHTPLLDPRTVRAGPRPVERGGRKGGSTAPPPPPPQQYARGYAVPSSRQTPHGPVLSSYDMSSGYTSYSAPSPRYARNRPSPLTPDDGGRGMGMVMGPTGVSPILPRDGSYFDYESPTSQSSAGPPFASGYTPVKEVPFRGPPQEPYGIAYHHTEYRYDPSGGYRVAGDSGVDAARGYSYDAPPSVYPPRAGGYYPQYRQSNRRPSASSSTSSVSAPSYDDRHRFPSGDEYDTSQQMMYHGPPHPPHPSVGRGRLNFSPAITPDEPSASLRLDVDSMSRLRSQSNASSGSYSSDMSALSNRPPLAPRPSALGSLPPTHSSPPRVDAIWSGAFSLPAPPPSALPSARSAASGGTSVSMPSSVTYMPGFSVSVDFDPDTDDDSLLRASVGSGHDHDSALNSSGISFAAFAGLPQMSEFVQTPLVGPSPSADSITAAPSSNPDLSDELATLTLMSSPVDLSTARPTSLTSAPSWMKRHGADAPSTSLHANPPNP